MSLLTSSRAAHPVDYDVIIVGAGPVGSTAASIAARHGLKTLLVDKSLQVFPLPRAIHFDADIMRIFQFAGLSELIEPRVRATAGGVHLGVDGEPIRDFRVPATVGDLGWKPHYMFYQPEIDALLRKAAAERPEVTARFGWECESVVQDDIKATVELLGPDGHHEFATSRYVIATDGASSRIRNILGIKLLDHEFEEPWVIIDGQVKDDDLGPNYTIMYCDPSRPGTYVPGPAKHRRWEFMILPGESGDQYTTDAGARSLIDSVTPWIGDAELAIERVAVYSFHALVATKWRDGRVFLAGDAAHQTPPFYGQGMCHGIRDVRNALWKITAVLDGTADDELLDTYEQERAPHVQAIISQAVANGRYICTLDPELALQRDRDLRAQAKQPKAARSFRDIIPGLTAGLLSGTDHSEARGLLFPQPVITTPSGSTVRLDALLDTNFALISAVPIPESTSAEWDGKALQLGIDIDDESGTIQSFLDTFGLIAVMVRPDRYVFGGASEAADIAPLVSALRLVPADAQQNLTV